MLEGVDTAANGANPVCMNSSALQRYILLCAQQYPEGGLRDKPGKPRDYYHTCYNLGGLSVAQHPPGWDRPAEVGDGAAAAAGEVDPARFVWGARSNRIPEVHPTLNVRRTAADAAMAHFGQMVCDHGALLVEAAGGLD